MSAVILKFPAPEKPAACRAVDLAVRVGWLTPAVMIDGYGRELRGYIPTEKGRVWCGPHHDYAKPINITEEGCGND
jgi:hypothetical protein